MGLRRYGWGSGGGFVIARRFGGTGNGLTVSRKHRTILQDYLRNRHTAQPDSVLSIECDAWPRHPGKEIGLFGL